MVLDFFRKTQHPLDKIFVLKKIEFGIIVVFGHKKTDSIILYEPVIFLYPNFTGNYSISLKTERIAMNRMNES